MSREESQYSDKQKSEDPRNGFHSPLDKTGNPDHDSSSLETYEDPQDAREPAEP